MSLVLFLGFFWGVVLIFCYIFLKEKKQCWKEKPSEVLLFSRYLCSLESITWQLFLKQGLQTSTILLACFLSLFTALQYTLFSGHAFCLSMAELSKQKQKDCSEISAYVSDKEHFFLRAVGRWDVAAGIPISSKDCPVTECWLFCSV